MIRRRNMGSARPSVNGGFFRLLNTLGGPGGKAPPAAASDAVADKCLFHHKFPRLTVCALVQRKAFQHDFQVIVE